jgi:hypothetical protein
MMPGNEPIQGTLMPAIQKIPCDVLDVLLALFSEQKSYEVGVEMVPLRFCKTRPIHIECGTKNIHFFCEEHHTSHPSSDGNDVLLSVFYGRFRKSAKVLRVNKIDYKTLSETERLEFREKSDKIFNDIHKNVLYLNHYKPKFTRLPTHDELIRCCEDLIEKIENDEIFPDKEKVLNDLNKILERLKREDRIIFK